MVFFNWFECLCNWLEKKSGMALSEHGLKDFKWHAVLENFRNTNNLCRGEIKYYPPESIG